MLFVIGSSRGEEIGLGQIGDTWHFVCCLKELIFRSFVALNEHIYQHIFTFCVDVSSLSGPDRDWCGDRKQFP